MSSVLFVETDPTIVASVEAAFRGAGIAIATAPSGREARIVAERLTPIALVASLDATGVEALIDGVRTTPALSSVPVILVTSSFPEVVRTLVERSGAREVLRKPIEGRAVLEAFRRCVRPQRGRPPEESPLKNEVRRRILEVLRYGERSAGDIARILDRRRPSLSHHFSELARHGLVRCRQDGPYRYYSLEPKRVLEAWNDWLAL